MKSRWFLVLAAILGLTLFASLPVPAATAATPSIKLVLGGTGATPWAIGPLAPGDNGTKSVTLSNTGSNGGVVTIWISDIANSEGANPQSEIGNTAEPGELSDHILLTVSGTNLSTDFSLPAKISDFPRSDDDTKHIYLNPLKAFGTLDLQWQWQLPLETGDDIQGDRLSFTINYTLEEFPQLPPPPPSPPGEREAPQARDSVGMTQTNPSSPSAGSTGSYTLTATNTGATVLNDVMVTVYLPELLNFQSSIPAGTVTGNQITWNLGFLNIGETEEIVVMLSGVTAGTAAVTVTMTTREGVTSTYSLGVTVLAAPGAPAPFPALPPAASAPLPALAPSLVIAWSEPTPAEKKETSVIGVLPVVLPPPSETPNLMSFRLAPAISAGIGAAALVYYIVLILIRKRRWDWIPYILMARAARIAPQTTEQRILYAAKHQKRVAELASAIAREMNLSKKLADRNILLEARIMAVADTVETVADTVKRTSLLGHYRLANSLDRALEDIKQSSNALYDSEVIKAFVRLADRGKFGFQTSYD